MSTWVFVRHGESEANAAGWLAGSMEVDLTATGVEQARSLRPALAEMPFERALVSPLRRAWRTAELALEGHSVPWIPAPALQERALGEWAGRSREDLRRNGEIEVLFSWDKAPPGGESQLSLARRTLTFLGSLPEGEGPTIVVSHGGTLRLLFGLLDGLPAEEIGTRRVPNAVLERREIPAGTWWRLMRRLPT